MRRLYLDGVDQPFARVDSNNVAAWYLTDHLGSVRDVMDKAGATDLDQLVYDAYGNITSESSTTNGDRYKYTGREWDGNTRLQDNRARYYDPRIGRWVSQDPLGKSAGDLNFYRYANNDPTNALDPSGLNPNELPWCPVKTWGDMADYASIGGGSATVDGKKATIQFFPNATLAVGDEKHVGIAILYIGPRFKEVQFVQVVYGYAWMYVNGKKEEVQFSTPIMTTAGQFTLSDSDKKRIFVDGLRLTTREGVSINAGLPIGFLGSVSAGPSGMLGAGVMCRAVNQVLGNPTMGPTSVNPFGSKVFIDAPTIGSGAAERINEYFGKEKPKPGYERADVEMHLSTYLVLDQKPFYRVDWETRAQWVKGKDIGINVTRAEGGGEVTGLRADDLAALTSQAPGQNVILGSR